MEVADPALAERVTKGWRDAGLSPREQTLCAFAEKLTRTPGAVIEADLGPLRALGLDDTTILDLVQVVAFFNYINRVADGLGVDLEPFMPAANKDGKGRQRGPEAPSP